jgi:toxin FitB
VAAQCRGQIRGDRPLTPIDALLAATALVHDLTFVTRSTRDIASTGVRLLDPFADG